MIKNFILLIFFSFSFFSNKSDLKQVKYNFSTEPIDVIIPCTIKDKICLEKCINCIKEHGKNIRRIVVVSKTKLTNKAEWFDEEKFPFNFKEIAYELFKDEKKATNYLKSKKNRLGWLFQQLIKFYAIYTIPNISSNVLMLDADVIYLNHTSFINKKTNAAYLNRAKEHHPSYFEHGKRLIPGFYKVKKID